MNFLRYLNKVNKGDGKFDEAGGLHNNPKITIQSLSQSEHFDF